MVKDSNKKFLVIGAGIAALLVYLAVAPRLIRKKEINQSQSVPNVGSLPLGPGIGAPSSIGINPMGSQNSSINTRIANFGRGMTMLSPGIRQRMSLS